MALHLNLYHEIKLQQVQRQRDPLKLGLYALVVIAGILLIYYAYRVQQASSTVSRSKQLQTQWQITEPKAKDADVREKMLKTNIQIKDSLVQHIEGRFYWAPLMQKMLLAIPRNVQITGFQGIVSPATSTGSITLNGIAAGLEPRKASEDFRTTFIAKCLDSYKSVTSKFVSLNDSDASVLLDGKKLNAANFILQFDFSYSDPSAEPVQQPKNQQKKSQKGGGK